MNFYGLWISNTSQEKIQECIESGIWKKDNYPNEENRKYERQKINELKIGSKVFLYFDSGEVSISETNFSQYLSTDEYDHSKKIVKVLCPAIGTVKSKNLKDVSLEVEWDKKYISTEWYMYYRQDGIWRFTDKLFTKPREVLLKEALYNIVFNMQKFDFEWWYKHLDWSKKKIKGSSMDVEEQFIQWLSKQKTRNGNIFGLKYAQSLAIHLKKTIPSWDIGIENLFNVDDIKEIEVLHQRCGKHGDLYRFSYSVGSGAPMTALKNYKEFLQGNKTEEFLGINNKEIVTKTIGFQKKQSLNQILYGPPGTGKTYHTIYKALEIIDGSVSDKRQEAKERFEVLKETGQIEFVTFHQSYGYEEFVEGIKTDVDSEDIRYSIEDGIFKRLSDIAKKNYLKSNHRVQTKKDFEEVFKEKILDKLDDDKLKIDTPQKYFYITDVNDRTIFFEKASGNTGHTLSIRSLKKMYEIGKNDFLVGGLSVYYQPILELLLENAEITTEPEELKNYILIIDEINRGNISKIFGELITLIEDSKRLGSNEAMEVTLPYSGEKFGVPSNLYIIGTMNTADRSIALMDTALRRRFEFEEMMPKPELLDEVDSIDLNKLLSKINQRIEYLYDRDHTIGHAYFIDVKNKADLDSAMKNKVIPLLQEYFYDDWEKIRLVLNDGFISKIEQKPNDIFDSIDDEFVDEEKYSYAIVDNFSEEAYRKIYE